MAADASRSEVAAHTADMSSGTDEPSKIARRMRRSSAVFVASPPAPASGPTTEPACRPTSSPPAESAAAELTMPLTTSGTDWPKHSVFRKTGTTHVPPPAALGASCDQRATADGPTSAAREHWLPNTLLPTSAAKPATISTAVRTAGGVRSHDQGARALRCVCCGAYALRRQGCDRLGTVAPGAAERNGERAARGDWAVSGTGSGAAAEAGAAVTEGRVGRLDGRRSALEDKEAGDSGGDHAAEHVRNARRH